MNIFKLFIEQHPIAFIIIWSTIFTLIMVGMTIFKENVYDPWHYDSILYKFKRTNTNMFKPGEPATLPFKFIYNGTLIETNVRDKSFNEPEYISFYTCPPQSKTLYINHIPVYCIYKLNRKRVMYWNTEYSINEAKAIIKYGSKVYNKRITENSSLSSKTKSYIHSEPKHGDIKYEEE